MAYPSNKDVFAASSSDESGDEGKMASMTGTIVRAAVITDGSRPIGLVIVRQRFTMSLRSQDEIRTKEGLTVKLHQGSITQLSVDAIVNATVPSLQLAKGGLVSQAILRDAGGDIQTEINRRYPRGISGSEVAVTGAHRLPSKVVFHGSLGQRNAQHPEQEEISTFVIKCLVHSHSNGLKTIAFPAIGTANLGFTREQCFAIMMGSVCAFSRHCPATPLETVSFVAWDPKTIEEFRGFFATLAQRE